MANPFKEADKARKKAPGNAREEQAKEAKGATPVKEEKPVEEVVATAKEQKPVDEDPKKNQPVSDLLSGLKLNIEKPTSKTYAFYISDENAEKLKKLAKKNGISTSKLLDHILSEVL